MIRPLVVAACIAAAPAAVGAILAVPAAASPGIEQFSSNAPLENAPLQPGPDIDLDPDIDIGPDIDVVPNVPNVNVPNVNVPNVNLPNVPGNVNVPNVNVPNVDIVDDIAADIVPDLNVVDDIADIVPDVNLNVPNSPQRQRPQRQRPQRQGPERWRWRPRRRWPSVTERPHPWPIGGEASGPGAAGSEDATEADGGRYHGFHPSVEPRRPAPGCAW